MNKFFQAFLSFVLIFVTAVSIVCLKQMQKPLFDCDKGVHTYYKYSKSSSCQICVADANCIKNPLCFTVKGQSIFLDFNLYGKKYCSDKIFKEIENKKGELVFEERGSWGINYYYYSKKIPFYCIINNKRVNLQVAISQKGITIGSPLIFGSY